MILFILCMHNDPVIETEHYERWGGGRGAGVITAAISSALKDRPHVRLSHHVRTQWSPPWDRANRLWWSERVTPCMQPGMSAAAAAATGATATGATAITTAAATAAAATGAAAAATGAAATGAAAIAAAATTAAAVAVVVFATAAATAAVFVIAATDIVTTATAVAAVTTAAGAVPVTAAVASCYCCCYFCCSSYCCCYLCFCCYCCCCCCWLYCYRCCSSWTMSALFQFSLWHPNTLLGGGESLGSCIDQWVWRSHCQNIPASVLITAGDIVRLTGFDWTVGL